MEENSCNLKLSFKEVLNSLVILQTAVQNEANPINRESIDDNLEIIIEKFSMVLKEFGDLCEQLELQQFKASNPDR